MNTKILGKNRSNNQNGIGFKNFSQLNSRANMFGLKHKVFKNSFTTEIGLTHQRHKHKRT